MSDGMEDEKTLLMVDKTRLSEKETVEMDEETHRKLLAEIEDRYGGPLATLPILREIRADQIKTAQEHRSQYGRIADTLTEQNTAVNRLATDVAGLSVRTATIEIEQQKHATLLGQVKERQDGCAARISHGDDTTEIRDLRTQLQKAVQRRSTPPRGIRIANVGPDEATGGWWSSAAGKAVLTALAGLLVAIASAITTWAAMSPSSPPAAPQRAPITAPDMKRFDMSYPVDDSTS